MAGQRWTNLDFEPRPARRDEETGETRRAGETESRGTSRTPEAPNAVVPSVVAHAAGAYLLRNYQAVLDLLEPSLRDDPELAGGQRILAHALARLDREPEAIDRLREAIRQSPADWLAQASLATLLLRSPEEYTRSSGWAPGEQGRDVVPHVAEAVAHLEAACSVAARPALRELLGAARWRSGQAALRCGLHAEAVEQFAAAGAAFAAAAETSGAARRALPVRHSSAFVGQAVALLLEGQIERAQQLFSRSPVPGVAVADPLGRFAAGLYELCEELARVPAAERFEAVAALREIVLQVRLAVGFFDGRQAVSLTWMGARG